MKLIEFRDEAEGEVVAVVAAVREIAIHGRTLVETTKKLSKRIDSSKSTTTSSMSSKRAKRPSSGLRSGVNCPTAFALLGPKGELHFDVNLVH
jgi:hypothetical protein